MMHSRIEAKPLTRATLEAVEGLTRTADQISLLLEYAATALREFQESVARRDSELAGCGDWANVLGLLEISEGLVDKIRTVSGAVEESAYPAELV